MFSFKGKNPTTMYYEAIQALIKDGDECSPRGKLIKELRPASVEFQNPFNRVTFLGSRRINPFFQIAESLWICSGRADVEWLCQFNANMKSFSDDGVYFNAPYGERIRTWNKNAAHNVIINPIDQLVDAYLKLMADKDTRQAVVVISNPMFDNSKYTIGEQGKDIACLSGDTIVSSPEGDIKIKDLVNLEDYPVYSYNFGTNSVEIKRVLTGGLTRKNSKLLEITLGDGTKIKATPDHLFYVKKYETNMSVNLTTGIKYPVNSFVGYEKVQAEDLQIGDRLPYLLRYEEAQGYACLNTSKLSKSISKGSKEHIMYMEYLLGRSLDSNEVVHHKNHIRNQNFKDNLEVLTKSYHDSLDMIGNTHPQGSSKKRTPKELLTKDNLFKVSVELVQSGEVLTEDTFKTCFEGVGCFAACKRHFGKFLNLKESVYSYLGISVPNGLGGSAGDYNSTKIVDIQEVQNEDVYDITVEDNHNFFANGYLVHNCNLIFTFKIRHDKLNMTVFNRSNDAHWGLWGANLCQFTTIQEVMLNWLKHSGNEEFSNLEIGEYCQLTDSLHIYLDDYGAKCTTDILDYYKNNPEDEVSVDFTCNSEPRMSLNQKQFDDFLTTFWGMVDPYLSDDNYMGEETNVDGLIELVEDLTHEGVIDNYWNFGIKSMIIYRLIKLDNVLKAVSLLDNLQSCQWKISMMYFLKSFIHKLGKDELRVDEYNEISDTYCKNLSKIKSDLIYTEWVETLEKYLSL